MLGPQIFTIDLKVPEQAFLDDFNNAAQAHPCAMLIAGKRMQMRLSAKDMLKIDVANDSNTVTFSIVAERDTYKQELIFTPFKLKNMRGSFFTSDYDDIASDAGTDEDAANFALDFLCSQCLAHNGTIAFITSTGSEQIVRDGAKKTPGSLALVDTDNNLYTSSNAKMIKDSFDEGDGISFKIQTPINTWLKENPDVQRAISQLKDVGAKMNYIGQYLIQARLNDEIAQDEFMDIFRQAGIFGFTNPSVQSIYKLIS